MKTAILAIFLFLVMIFPHELGHYIAAKKCGVQVNEFAFGMGPVIWKKKRGETLHSIRLFPIGGFCSMEGEDGDEDEEGKDDSYNPRAFNNKKPWQKIIILFAGAGMNVLCAFLIMTILVTYLGFSTMVIGEISPDSPAEISGLMVDDKVLSVNDKEVESWTEFSESIQMSGGKELRIEVERDGEVIDKSVTPELIEEENRYIIGTFSKLSHDPVRGIGAGFSGTVRLFGVMFDSLKIIFTGKAGVDEISGPVGIVRMVGETSREGMWTYLFLMALICVNLAVINLLPLPALDGGRIIIVLFGWITGRKVSAKVEGIIHACGMILLLGLVAFITVNDIAKLF